MQSTHFVFGELIAQTQQLQSCIEQEDTQRFLKHLKKRSTLLHQTKRIIETGSEYEQQAARRVIEELLATDQQIQERLSDLKESLHTRMELHQKQRQLANSYRPSPTHHRPGLVT